MENSKVYFRGYLLTPKNSVERKVYDNSNTGYKAEDVVRIAYVAAFNAYSRFNWKDIESQYPLEDFKQDAAMYILDKFNEGYFDASQGDIFPIVYRLINGHFIYNKYVEYRDVEYVLPLNRPVDFGNPGQREVEYLDGIADPERPNPEDLLFKEVGAKSGKEIVKDILKELSVQPFNTHKYEYVGIIDGNRVDLTEVSVGELILQGKGLHDILNVFGYEVSNSGSTSQTAYIAKIVKRTRDKIVEVIKCLETDGQCSIRDYFELLDRRTVRL
jgi:hypothetical protein